MLASLRADSVGMDTGVYVIPAMKLANRVADCFSFLEYYDGSYGFYLIVFFLTKIFNSQPVVLFAIHLIIICGWLYFLVSSKRMFNISACFGYMIALLFLYNQSLTVMRQSTAISIGLIALIQLIKKRYVLFGVFAFLSVLFHTSMICFITISLFLHILMIYLDEKRENKKILLSLLLFLLAMVPVNTYVAYFGDLLNSNYADRIELYGGNKGGILTVLVYFFLAAVPLLVCYRKKMPLYFFLNLPIIGFLFQLSGRSAIYLTRLAIPFSALIMLSIPFAIRNRHNQVAVILFFMFFWILTIYIRRDWQTVPYVFAN